MFSIDEIEHLREVLNNKYLYGTYNPVIAGGDYMSRQYHEADLTIFVEEQIRTFMAAGITADDLLQHENEQREKRKKVLEDLVQRMDYDRPLS